jgi:hypothetical protein
VTPEQMELMIRVFQFGFSTGVTNRFEMLRKYCNAYPLQKFEIISVATEFEKGCGCSLEQAEELRELTPIQFAQWLFPDKSIE